VTPKSAALRNSGLKVVATPARPLRLGVAGPVGSGKTTLVAALCRALSESLSLAVVVDDARGAEDARQLCEAAVGLAPERIAAVQTGCSPQTAIREDIAANLDAVEALEAAHAPLDLVIVESGGTDLTATFSSGLADRQIFVLDAAAGERVVRKGGPALARADLLLVNRTDLAPHVGADLEVLRRDALALRSLGPGGVPREQPLPTVFTSLAEHPDAPAVVDWVKGLIVERTVLVDA
jgi:urease accessory protein